MSNAQHETAPASTAPKQREITCVHEAGHAVAGVVLFGSITGARVNPDGTGVVWRGKTPSDDRLEYEQAARTALSDTEDHADGCRPDADPAGEPTSGDVAKLRHLWSRWTGG